MLLPLSLLLLWSPPSPSPSLGTLFECGGLQTRPVVCVAVDNTTRADSACASQGLAKPSTVQRCGA